MTLTSTGLTLADLFPPDDLTAAIEAGHVTRKQHPTLPLLAFLCPFLGNADGDVAGAFVVDVSGLPDGPPAEASSVCGGDVEVAGAFGGRHLFGSSLEPLFPVGHEVDRPMTLV